MREWFDQVKGTKRGRGRPKITLVKVVKKINMLIKEVTKRMILDRIEWQRKNTYGQPRLIHWGSIADP